MKYSLVKKNNPLYLQASSFPPLYLAMQIWQVYTSCPFSKPQQQEATEPSVPLPANNYPLYYATLNEFSEQHPCLILWIKYPWIHFPYRRGKLWYQQEESPSSPISIQEAASWVKFLPFR